MIKAVCKCRFAQIYLTWEERRQGKRVWLKMIIDLFTWYPHVRPRKQQILLDNFWWPTSVPSTHCQFLHRVLHSFRWWALSQYDHKRMSNVTAYSHTYRMPQYLRHENTKGDRFHLVWNWFNAKEAATFLIDTLLYEIAISPKAFLQASLHWPLLLRKIDKKKKGSSLTCTVATVALCNP